MATPDMLIYAPSGICNVESVNTHISIHPVAILEQFTSTVAVDTNWNNAIMIIVFTKI